MNKDGRVNNQMPKSDAIDSGLRKIYWTQSHLRMLTQLEKELSASKPFMNLTIGICLHVEPKTAVFCKILQTGGAKIALTGSPGTTQDDVAAALANMGIYIYGRQKEDRSQHIQNIRNVVGHRPQLFLDNGADIVNILLEEHMYKDVFGGTEETTTGANRLREEFPNKIPFPIIVINDSPLKQIVENEHGVGETVVEGFMRTTNLIIHGKRFVVIGYGSCGRGIAKYLNRFGGRVTVVELDPIRALQAAFDGLQVARLDQVLDWGEVFITVTGRPTALTLENIEKMADGAILANAGHFSWEIDLDGLRKTSIKQEQLNDAIEEFTLPDGKKVTLLSHGEMINLASGNGNPIETMDMGLTLQALSLKLIAEKYKELPKGPHSVPHEINIDVANRMLNTIFTKYELERADHSNG